MYEGSPRFIFSDRQAVFNLAEETGPVVRAGLVGAQGYRTAGVHKQVSRRQDPVAEYEARGTEGHGGADRATRSTSPGVHRISERR